MKLSLQPLVASLAATLHQPWFWLVLLLGLGVGAAQSFVWLDWFSLVGGLLFGLGVLIGYWLIDTHQAWMSLIVGSLPGAAEEDTSSVSVLRSPLLFLLLPVLGVFLFLLPRVSVGLGVFWGVSAWYGREAWMLLQSRPEWLQRYFPRESTLQDDPIYLAVLWGFLGFVFVFSLGLILF